MKTRTNVSIDHDILEKAKAKGLNISGFFERELRKRVNQEEVLIENKDICEFCNKAETRATVDNPKGLTWLFPDEKWICNSCLRNKSETLK